MRAFRKLSLVSLFPMIYLYRNKLTNVYDIFERMFFKRESDPETFVTLQPACRHKSKHLKAEILLGVT